MSVIGTNTTPGHRTKYDHRLSAEEHDPHLSAERIVTATVMLCDFAGKSADRPGDEVSPTEKRRLSQAAALLEAACDLW